MEVFEPAEHALYEVTVSIGVAIVCVGMLSGWIGWDDGVVAALGQIGADLAGIIPAEAIRDCGLVGRVG